MSYYVIIRNNNDNGNNNTIAIVIIIVTLLARVRENVNGIGGAIPRQGWYYESLRTTFKVVLRHTNFWSA